MKNPEIPPSINQIFEHRKDYILEVGKQLEKEKRTAIEVNGEKLNIDYRVISLKNKEHENSDPVVLLPGFGSGWEGISELGFSLACEGRKVIMTSLPGYGNSDNPSKKYYQQSDFSNEADVIKKLLEQMESKGEIDNRKVHLVGHSVGSEIMASFAEKYPEKVSSLVLLNPAGVKEKENITTLGPKFVLSGARTSIDFAIKMRFSGEDDYEKEIGKYIPKTKSPFSKDRLSQRLSEGKKLSNGRLLEKIKNIKDVPITYISGEFDTLFPPGNEEDINSQLTKIVKSVDNTTKIEKSIMSGLRHNTTIAPDEITAANIEHYMEKAEKKTEKIHIDTK